MIQPPVHCQSFRLILIDIIIAFFFTFMFIDPIDPFPLIVTRTFVRFSKLPLPLVSFRSYVRIFLDFLLSLIANNVFLLLLNFRRNKTN